MIKREKLIAIAERDYGNGGEDDAKTIASILALRFAVAKFIIENEEEITSTEMMAYHAKIKLLEHDLKNFFNI